MRKRDKFLPLLNALWPTRHFRFEEMCTLAVTGQLGGPQMCELDNHIAGCNSCREFLESIAQVSVQAMPLLAEQHAPGARILPPPGIRERFLARMASEATRSGNVSLWRPLPAPANAYSRPTERAKGEPIAERLSHTLKASFSSSRFGWRAFAVAAGSVIVAFAYYAGTRKAVDSNRQSTQSRPLIAPAPVAPEIAPGAIDSDRVRDLDRQQLELEATLIRTKQELTTATTKTESLGKELMAAQEKLAALTNRNMTGPAQGLVGGSQRQAEEVSTLQAQVAQLKKQLAESEIDLSLQKQTSDELNARLETMAADLAQERELKSAKSELGDVVAARNLHIVDVYDADPSGKRQRSFGRVFYIEGKSLVFYAYDLGDARQLRANVVFHVWGGRVGVKEATHNLGILHKDDDSQNRWAMTFDDPNVLTQINSVFVTAESARKQYDQPRGKRVLYAYFGSPPNHP